MATEPTELTGKVINGVVVFENGESLPEGTPVKIEPLSDVSQPKPPSRLAKMLLSHAGVIDDPDLPTDLADNLDHYLYGTPKRK
jgi:hypothetical protein